MAYTYLVKHTPTNKFYVGYRSAHGRRSPIDDIWVYYFTSSSKVKDLIREYGADTFEVKILFEYDDDAVCYWHEQVTIRSYIGNLLLLNGQFVDPDSNVHMFDSTNKKWYTDGNVEIKSTSCPDGFYAGRAPKMVTVCKVNSSNKLGKANTARHNENIRRTKLGVKRSTIKCIHCGKEGIHSNINRWHNSNCKFRQDISTAAP